MVKFDFLGILDKHGLLTPEVQLRAKMLDAVMNKRYDDPVLRENLTPEQMRKLMDGNQSAGAIPDANALVDKAKELTDIPEAKDIAKQGMAIARGEMDTAKANFGQFTSGLGDIKGKIPTNIGDAQGAVKEKLGSIVNNLPGVENIKKKFEGKDPVTGLARELDYEKSDGFLTMIVKMFLNTITDIMGSPVFPLYVRALFGFMFVLSYAQSLPIFGGLIRAALEIVTFIVTIIGTSILSLGNMAGPPGHIIGLIIASVFFVLSAMISFLRKQFTEAIVVAANLIPFVGMPISNALQRADIAGKKLVDASKKIHDSFIDLLAAVFDVKGRVRGGIRFSRRQKNTKKWRTQRKRRMFGRR